MKMVVISTLSCRCCYWSCSRGRSRSSCCSIIIPTWSCWCAPLSWLCGSISCLRLPIRKSLLAVALLITLLLRRLCITISIISLLGIALLSITLLLAIGTSLVSIPCSLRWLLLLLVTPIITLLTIAIGCCVRGCASNWGCLWWLCRRSQGLSRHTSSNRWRKADNCSTWLLL